MKIHIVTDKSSLNDIKRNISENSTKYLDAADVDYILEEDLNEHNFTNYLLIIEDEDEHFLEIASAGIKCKYFSEIIICENLTTTSYFINTIKAPPIICTIDFKIGSSETIWEDIQALYKSIKSKYSETIVIGYSQFENQTTDDIGDQANKLKELFHKNKDSVFDKTGMSPKTLANIFRDKIDLLKYQKEVEELRTKINHLEGFDKIIGKSKALSNILSIISKVAITDARVLITGENGTGKELIAKALHIGSNRKNKQLIVVNCPSIPSELIESELFGHEKGSFTGASAQRIGKFELANDGTLFLDEIGDMSLPAQAKVLRAIEEGQIERVGSTKKIDVNIRLICATNKNLQEEIIKGNFREDLFHRINVIQINIPPLRERKEDIPLLVEHFSKTICEKNKFQQKSYSESAMQVFKNYEWKGNVRELRNVIERIVIMSPEQEITNIEVGIYAPSAIHHASDILGSSSNFLEVKEKFEKEFLLRQLNTNNWDFSETAKSLGIAASSLHHLIAKYSIAKVENDNITEIPFVEVPNETNDCSEAEIFLDKIEGILIEHFPNISKVKEEEVAPKFTSTIKGQSGITREHFITSELGPHKPCIEKLLSKYPDRWENARKCKFIKNAKAAKK